MRARIMVTRHSIDSTKEMEHTLVDNSFFVYANAIY
jgi:hypothetical protein